MFVAVKAVILRRRRLRWTALQARLLVYKLERVLLSLCCGSQGPPPMVSPREEGFPVAAPLTTLDQLKDRTLFSSPNFEFVKSTIPFNASARSERRPRLLVCHDYKGGYQEDKWVQGHEGDEGYAIWHWHLIDVFIYFSHSLVSLPPAGWINAAHTNGVQVLGTFITEWAQGASTCRSLLARAETSRMYASRLAELAHTLGFDGWLINIENEVDMKDLPRLHLFLQHLRDSMHILRPGSLVIWYDAVTEDGNLDWQNCLTEKNRFFFDDCDGLFTNYKWTEGMAKLSADVAGERAADVYMGVDVFGRNTFGGGGFKVLPGLTRCVYTILCGLCGAFHRIHKLSDVALKVAQNAEVSAALFAPGWVFETHQPPCFEVAQTRWWGTIEQCWPVARFNPTALPFFSDFNRGFGRKMYEEGEEISTQPWFNLSCQSLQPILRVISKAPHAQQSLSQVSVSHEMAFSGGSCIKFLGSGSQSLVLLYEAHVPVVGTPLHISYSVLLENGCQFCLAMRIRREYKWSLVLLSEKGEEVLELPHSEKVRFAKQSVCNDDAMTRVARNNKWKVHNHVLELGTCVLCQIYGVIHPQNKLDVENLVSTIGEDVESSNGLTSTSKIAESELRGLYLAFLGSIRIATSEQHENILPAIIPEECNPQWIQAPNKQKAVNVTLRWSLQVNGDRQGGCRWIQYYLCVRKKQVKGNGGDLERGNTSDYTDAEFLGVATVEAFYVSECLVPEACSLLEFSVQAQCVCGERQTLRNAPMWWIQVPSPSIETGPTNPETIPLTALGIEDLG